MYNSLALSRCNDPFVSSRQQHLNTKSLKLCMKEQVSVETHAIAKDWNLWHMHFVLFIYISCMIFLPHLVLLFCMCILQYEEWAFAPECGQSSCLAAGLPDWSPSWSPPWSSCLPRSSCVWTYLWRAPDEDNNHTDRDSTHPHSLWLSSWPKLETELVFSLESFIGLRLFSIILTKSLRMLSTTHRQQKQ